MTPQNVSLHNPTARSTARAVLRCLLGYVAAVVLRDLARSVPPASRDASGCG